MSTSILFGNGTNIVHWRESPNTRGTFDILSSCLLTLVLCVWTAVHLNVPKPRGTWTNFLERLVGITYALAAPEFVAYVAWYQKQSALDLLQKVNYRLGFETTPYRKTYRFLNLWRSAPSYGESKGEIDHEDPGLFKQNLGISNLSPSPTQNKWTLRHGFYALMGGYAIKTTHIADSQRFLPESETRHFFLNIVDLHNWDKDSDGSIRDFANHLVDELPDLSEEDIWSKTKADGAAKTLTCIQALWFMAQCITRLAMHTPISLLELNTFGHTVCALIIYVIWWNKPYNVEFPTPVFSHRAFLLLATWYFYTQKTPILEHLQEQGFTCTRERDLVECTTERPPLDDPTMHSVVLRPGETLPGTGWALKKRPSDGKRMCDVVLSPQDIKRWQMAWEFGQTTAWNFGHFRFHEPAPEVTFWEALTHEHVRDHVGLCIETQLLEEIHVGSVTHFSGLGLGLTFVNLIYGGLHALAWFAHFRTSVEVLLWRISASVVMGGVASVQLTHLLPYSTGSSKAKGAWVLYSCLVFWAYLWARGYLVVECFINLANLPSGVYEVPQWPTYFPHISS